MKKTPFFLIAAILATCIYSCRTDPSQDEPAFKNTNNTVYVRLPAEPDKINPLTTTNTYARVVNECVFFYLLDFDPQTLELSPQLAVSQAVVEEIGEGKYAGGVAYTFEIHPDAVWDNGAPITGKDMAFTLKALFNPLVNSGPQRTYLEFIRDFRIDPGNPKRFTVVTDRKYILGEAAISNIPIFPEYLYDPSGLMSSYTVEQLATPETARQLAAGNAQIKEFAEAFNSPKYSREKGFVAGAGPYQFEEWVTGQQIVITKKKNWWGDKLAEDYPMLAAHPDTIVFKIIPDQTTGLAGLKDESIDVSSQIDAKDFTDLKKNEQISKLFNLYSVPSMLYYYIGLNTQHPLLNDKRVRRALAHAVDVDEAVNSLFYGMAERTVGPVNPSKEYYHKGLEPIAFDLGKARELLEEAGWEDTNGNGVVDKVVDGVRKELELSYLVSSGSKFGINLALLVQDNARKAGVKVNIVSKEFTVLIDDLKKRNFELFGSGWGQDPTLDDPKQLWHTESDTPDGSNRVGFGNAGSDAVIDAIRVTFDKEKRDSLYLRFQEIVYDEQPYIFLFSPYERIAIHKRFDAKPSMKRPGFFVKDFVLRNAAEKQE